jgi:hypothetical protein
MAVVPRQAEVCIEIAAGMDIESLQYILSQVEIQQATIIQQLLSRSFPTRPSKDRKAVGNRPAL